MGLAEVTFGLAHASDSFPEWKAVKLTFFATLMSSTCLFYLAWMAGGIVMIHAGTIFLMYGVLGNFLAAEPQGIFLINTSG